MALSHDDLSSLGIGTPPPPGPTSSPEEKRAERSRPSWQALEPGAVVSRAIYETVSGRRVTLIDSAPGAGKSTLIIDLVLWIAHNTDLRIIVATPTRAAATAIAERIAQREDSASVVLALSGLEQASNRSIYTPGTGAYQGQSGDIVVRTMASLSMDTSSSADLLVVDEAYQSTYATLIAAAKGCEQVLLVGDPGQIGPVVTADTSVFEDREYPPHKRAPDALRGHSAATVLHLDRTYRLGARSVEAIAPLYDFPLASGRPDRHLVGHREIEAALVDESDPVDLYRRVAEIAASFVGTDLVADDESRQLRAADVAVVAGDNMAVNGIAGFLDAMGLFPGITVGTADRLQGGQWHAVVAVDPLAAASTVSEHHLSAGRLCVMASRQMTHLTWVHDGSWRQAIQDFETDEPKERLLAVRESLTSGR